MTFTRENPSPRYTELLSMYEQLHVEGEKTLGLAPEKTFNGFSLLPQVERIKRLIELTEADTILDYGSGKGQQYERPIIDVGGGQIDLVIDFWDVGAIDCFDPGYEPYSELPSEQYDGVISTDMLEHCPEEDVDWVIDELFSFAKLFVFANVASYPAKKTLPNGENAHCTIKPLDWWREKFITASRKHQIKTWQVVFTEAKDGKLVETEFGEEK